jgi:hypothetical protein
VRACKVHRRSRDLLATSGPGAIHLLNGLYDAKMDHQPVVAIVGQQARAALGGHYQQEVDLISLFKDVAQEYVSRQPNHTLRLGASLGPTQPPAVPSLWSHNRLDGSKPQKTMKWFNRTALGMLA